MAMPFSKNTKEPNPSSDEYRMLTEKEKKHLKNLGAEWEERLLVASIRKALGKPKR